MAPDHGAGRDVAAVTERVVLGPDSQVDRKAVVVEPGRWEVHDPFLLMFEDWFSAVGFEWHPHRGVETVTVVLEGELEHRDNSGGHGVLGPGDVQWMTAGRGIVHTELAHRGREVHTLQLWLNLPADRKLVAPRYQDLRGAEVPVRREPGVEARVFAGTSGAVTGPAQRHVPVTMVDVRLDPGAVFVQDLSAADRGFAYVLDGEGRFGRDAREVAAGQVAHFEAATDPADASFAATATSPLRFLLFAGPPLHEPVVAHGPFVMNTEAQIVEAFADYRAGRFGPVPAG